MSLKLSGLGEGATLKASAPILYARDEGSALASRSAINFRGPGVIAADNSTTAATDIHITSTASVGAITGLNRLWSPILFGYDDALGQTYQRIYLIPFYAHDFGTGTLYVESMSVTCSVANASAVARLGLYGPSDGVQVDLRPSGDLGTIALSSTGDKTLNVASGSRPSFVLGDWNYLAVVLQGNSTAKMTMSSVGPVWGQVNTLTGAFVKATQAYFDSGTTTGALPSLSYAPFSGSSTRTDKVPSVILRLTHTA